MNSRQEFCLPCRQILGCLLLATLAAGCRKSDKISEHPPAAAAAVHPAETPQSKQFDLTAAKEENSQPFIASSEKFGVGRPGIWVRTILFKGEITTPEVIGVDRDVTLEFVPMRKGAGSDGAILSAYVVSSGGEEKIYEGPACRLDRSDLEGPGRFRILETPVRVSLKKYLGSQVRIRWRMDKMGEDSFGAIANFSIYPTVESPERPPDILMFCSDMHRYDYSISPEGEKWMPNLKELRAHAVTYRQAFSTASWTLPSIASALTGLFPRYHLTGEIIRTDDEEGFDESRLKAGEFPLTGFGKTKIVTAYPNQLTTLMEGLRGAGYATCLVVANPFYITSGLAEDGSDVVVDASGYAGMAVDGYAMKILTMVGKHRPLFLLVHYMDVHQYKESNLGSPGSGFDPGVDPYFMEKKDIIEGYTKAVRDTDTYMGLMLKIWETRIGTGKSVIVFFSDHGEHLFDEGHPPVKGRLNKEETNSDDLAGAALLNHGNSMDEVLLHVPLVVKYPDGPDTPTAEVSTPVSLTDLYPTILHLAGINEPVARGSGMDLREGKGSEERVFFAERQLYGAQLASIRRMPHKLVVNLDSGEHKLYNLSSPPPGGMGEEGQLEDNREVESQLLALYDGYTSSSQKTTSAIHSNHKMPPKESFQNLEALGYLR
ncbi:sulfatase-like hydrolase/transferase [Candidatus Sumerlaeota bacterium]|nr:sulfatase-like hydrolase/transferase [Candidatus Sumerlaeota bacterium]